MTVGVSGSSYSRFAAGCRSVCGRCTMATTAKCPLFTAVKKGDTVCRQREAEVQEWIESASLSDRGLEEAQAKSTLVGFSTPHRYHVKSVVQ